MASDSSSSSFPHDVFLNFRGEDTRHGFTGHLYHALWNRKIRTFIDDRLESAKEITDSLLKAIEVSKIAITVFSSSYASSSFCLDELTYIVDCSRRKDLLILPVFYNVDPSHVRHQRESYREALATLEERYQHNMDKWKKALRKVADLSGFHLKHGGGYEYEFIGKIVTWVSNNIGRVPLYVVDHLVGLEPRVAQVMELLDVESDDGVHIIGIHGMGGVGKSTLARVVYNNLINNNFDGACFLGNMREESHKHGLKHLQSTLLQEIVGEKEIYIASVEKGTSMIQHRLHGMKVLLVLDDVDKTQQLQAIVGGSDWFGPGSRVIITTRDKQLLASYEVKRTYEVKEMNEHEAFQLLTWKAFKKEQADPTYEKVLKHVVAYASGLPLALEVIGSNLFGKNIEEWKSAIKHFKRIPNNQILEILRVSFDALGEEEKSVFLDIACCLKGYKLTEAQDILHALYDNCMKYHIGVLVEKSLIKISYDRVTMHDFIEDMAKKIDKQNSPKEPGERRRLWIPKEIVQVLKDNTGTRQIEIICLDFPISDQEERVEWNGNAFEEMKNLKILIIRNANFSTGPNCLPESLRVLEWQARRSF